jgi:hypothetical protein
MVIDFFSESKALKVLHMEAVLNSKRVSKLKKNPYLAKSHPLAQKDQMNLY